MATRKVTAGLETEELLCAFRHTFAVELLKRGVPAGTVAILLGNTEQIVVKHYSAWIESRQKPLDDAVEKANVGSAE